MAIKFIPKKPSSGKSRQSIAEAGVVLRRKSPRKESPYMIVYKASSKERIDIIRRGVPAKVVVNTGSDMGLSRERLLTYLQFPRSTIIRKIAKKESLPPELSERMIGLQKLIGQVESMVADSGDSADFNAAHWVAQWLEQPLPALSNAKPADYMDTVEGQEIIANLLARIQSGAYG